VYWFKERFFDLWNTDSKELALKLYIEGYLRAYLDGFSDGNTNGMKIIEEIINTAYL